MIRMGWAGQRLISAAIAAGILFFATPGAYLLVRAQLSTDDHLAEPGWWPRRTPASVNEFVGSAACAKCHVKKAASQEATPMAGTLIHAADADVLHTHTELRFQNGKYVYKINSTGGKPEFTVTDGNRTLSAPLLWAFGTGKVGQSYLFQRDGNYFESRITFFSSLQNIQFTPTRALLAPHDLEEAMARPVGLPEVKRCFSCHSAGSNIGGKFDTARLTAGITCEACHGPGLKHTTAMQASALQQGIGDEEGKRLIFDPAKLSPGDSVDFCGSCHITWWDVKLTHLTGIYNTRSQPYRLMSSKCWGNGDPRITCVACHDPHEPLSENAGSYDQKCLACHSATMGAKPTKEHPGAACPVGTKTCTTCHMPKIDLPDMHHTFADHRIRIVRQGEPIPE
jgi:Cytochrome c554 and c-prime